MDEDIENLVAMGLMDLTRGMLFGYEPDRDNDKVIIHKDETFPILSFEDGLFSINHPDFPFPIWVDPIHDVRIIRSVTFDDLPISSTFKQYSTPEIILQKINATQAAITSQTYMHRKFYGVKTGQILTIKPNALVKIVENESGE